MRARLFASAGLAAILLAPALTAGTARAAEAPQTVSPVTVVAPTPIGRPGVDADKLPAAIETLSAADLERRGSLSITDALEQRTPGLNLSDAQGNGFARDLNYRGFSASPLQGTPQGLAVYMGGVRLNEAFGDTVNWDLIPETAVRRIDLVTGNPAFGLNALGGALSLTMKTGRTAPGGAASVEGGSFGRAFASAEYGASAGPWSGYLALDGGREAGWRRQSGSSVARAYADVGWSGERGEWRLVAAAGGTRLGVVGPTPRDLLAEDRGAIFTFPQSTADRGGLVALNGAYEASGGWSLQGGLYGRRFRQDHVDGNSGDLEGCSADPANRLFATLCLQDDDFPDAARPPPAAFQVLGQDGLPIGCPPPAGQPTPCSGAPYGTIDRTHTRTTTAGASLQAVNKAALFGRPNLFSLGASFDESQVRFEANSTLGLIFPDLSVRTTPGEVPGAGQVIRTAGAIAYSPVVLHATTRAAGLYANDTWDVTDRLFLTLSGRFNGVRLTTADLTGVSPDLSGAHRFDRFNPAAGLAWKLTGAVTAYGGYAETNRAPTPLELSCSDPVKPCLLENALVSDPPLRQVVSRTWQAGLRGASDLADGHVDWRLGAYRSDNDDDIVALASAIQGRGSYANVPRTRREGLEAELNLRSGRWSAYASASDVEASYRFAGLLPSPNSPFADANGDVAVRPGDRIGGIAPGRLKVGAEVRLTGDLSVGADVLAVSAQRRIGDESNQDRKLAGYAVASLHAAWEVGRGAELFGRIDNLFDRRYATFGTYFDTGALDNLSPSPLPADPDPRNDTPAPPRALLLGLRVRW